VQVHHDEGVVCVGSVGELLCLVCVQSSEVGGNFFHVSEANFSSYPYLVTMPFE